MSHTDLVTLADENNMNSHNTQKNMMMDDLSKHDEQKQPPSNDPSSGIDSDESSHSGNSETSEEKQQDEQERERERQRQAPKKRASQSLPLETFAAIREEQQEQQQQQPSTQSSRFYTPSQPPPSHSHSQSLDQTNFIIPEFTPPPPFLSDDRRQPNTTFQTKGLLHLAHFQQPRMNLVLSFLTISQVVACQTVSMEFHRALKRYLSLLTSLDLSQFWGVIGSTDSTFYKFVSQCRGVRHLCLDYCTQLKSSHLDRILSHLCGESCETNENIVSLSLYYCKKLGPQATFKIAARLPNLQILRLGRCHLITSHENINGLKALTGLPLTHLQITLNPNLEHNDVMEIVSLLIYDDGFTHLRELDLSVGCRLLTHSNIDLIDIKERGIHVVTAETSKRRDDKRH